MIWLYLVAFVVMAAGIVLLLGLTPEKITDDLMGIFVPKQNLRDKILIAQGKKKSRKLTKEILHIKDALDATGKANQFTAACAASVVLMIVGCIFSVMIDNFFMIPVAAVIFASLPETHAFAAFQIDCRKDYHLRSCLSKRGRLSRGDPSPRPDGARGRRT